MPIALPLTISYNYYSVKLFEKSYVIYFLYYIFARYYPTKPTEELFQSVVCIAFEYKKYYFKELYLNLCPRSYYRTCICQLFSSINIWKRVVYKAFCVLVLRIIVARTRKSDQNTQKVNVCKPVNTCTQLCIV